jgi:hypothetical protein
MELLLHHSLRGPDDTVAVPLLVVIVALACGKKQGLPFTVEATASRELGSRLLAL